MAQIKVAGRCLASLAWRGSEDEIQVVSGPIGREKIHYEAPPGEKLDMEDRDEYYKILERTQKSDLDITGWLKWYLECYVRAVQKSEHLKGD